jgi:coenzyme F420-0:L-glutamate ligase/coenzyme F420-1:gamma-L-glutamate ligase
MTIALIPVQGIPEVKPGDDLGQLIAARADLADGDVVVVTQKVVSKAEGRLVPVDPADPLSHKAVVEQEAVRVLRRRGDLVMTETSHGFVCANSGVDLSNVETGWAALLPLDPDRSARWIRDSLRAKAGVEVGVIVSDTFGRTWRVGVTDVAIGTAGVAAVIDLRGSRDELAAAAELVMGKSLGIPAAVVRGVDPTWLRESSVRAEIVRPYQEDLFR